MTFHCVFEQEQLEKKKAEYGEKLKNKIATIHREAEEKRAFIEARQRCEFDLGLQHKKEPEVISLPLPSLVCCCCWKPKP